MKEKYDIQEIVIDYIQLMQGEKTKGGNREQEISSISRTLKGIAKELNIPVIALSQLSRAVESRPGANKRPMLSDLRESGSIEQDADLVGFLYRPEYYKIFSDAIGNSTLGMCELIFAKNRSGTTEDVKLRFNGAYMRFTDWEEPTATEIVKAQQANINFSSERDSWEKNNTVIIPDPDRDETDDDLPF